MRATPVLAIPLIALAVAACGGTSGAPGGPVAATVAAPSAGTTAVPAVTAAAQATTTPMPDGEWAFAPGVHLKGTANVGSLTDNGTSKTVTRLFVVDSVSEANHSVQYIDGAWDLPVPVGGEAPEGLAWNGRRAVLASTDGPSRFVTFPVGRDMSSTAAASHEIDLSKRGTFTFDALSTDGNWLYLAQSKDATGKRVDLIRAYDIARDELLADPVVDKTGGTEAMSGTPVAREFSADGNGVYTVYEGSEHPFVHALLTDNRISVCIDLEGSPAPTATGGWTIAWKDPSTLIVTSDRLKKRFQLQVTDNFPVLQRTEALGS